MKICYLASLGSNHTERWMKYFVSKGHKVHLITSGTVPNGGIEGVVLHVLRRFGPRTRAVSYLVNAVPKMIQFERLIRDIKPDIIHAHCIMEIALLGAFSRFRPFVVTVWGSEVLIAPQRSRAAKWVAEYVLTRADLVTCDAEHIKQPMVQLGADPQKIRLVCFGVDTEEFRPDKKDNRLRERLGIFDSPMIISTRRLEPVYDVATFVKSIPLVLAEFPDAKFVIGSNGSQREHLVQLAKSLGVFASVRFVGYVPSEELPVYLASSDLYVSTSLSDAGLAASTAEAMSCGLPVVVTDFGDNKLWVEDGANGFTVPVNNHESLASRIVFILKHKDVKERFGRRNRQIVQERNNWAKEMEKMQDLYKELICECGR